MTAPRWPDVREKVQARLAERWVIPLMNLGGQVAAAIPPAAGYALANVSGTAAYWLWPKKRSTAIDNFSVALGPRATMRQLHRTARQSFQSYARMTVEVLRSRCSSLEEIRRTIKLEGQQYLDASIARGKGVVAVLPHVGNWEPASNIIAFLPYQVLAIVDGGAISRAVATTRMRAGISVVEQSRAARPAIRALRNNSIVLVVADLVKDFRAVRVQLFGRETHLPAGPAYLALRTGAELVPIFSIRQADNTTVIYIEPPIALNHGADWDLETPRVMQEVARYFERVIQSHPEQWYPYRQLWGVANGA